MSTWKMPRGLSRIPLPVEAMPTTRQSPRSPAAPPRKNAGGDAVVLALLKAAGLPQPHREYRFHDTRLWRFDYAWPTVSLALEVNGGIWRKGGGAHTGTGHLRDMEKLNAAQRMGWCVLQYTPQQLILPGTIAAIADTFHRRPVLLVP